MKKTLASIALSVFVVLTTATFGFAEFAAAGTSNFPYFQLGALVVGGLIIISLKQRYDKIYLGEAVGSFALYTIMVSLFMAPVFNLIKGLVG